LGVGLGFDVCLFDERVAGVDKEFKPKAIEIVKAITAPRAIVVATSNPKEVADVCDTVFVLENSELTQFQNAEEGFAHFKSLVAKGTEEDSDIPDAGPEPAEEEFVLEVGI
jgi:ABC-type polysaccharide/polyol phosphate transport system ATPase subunit